VYVVGCTIGNTLNLYMGYTWFESLSGHQLSRFSSVPPGLYFVMTTSFQILPFHAMWFGTLQASVVQ